jgi:hypothetical protein
MKHVLLLLGMLVLLAAGPAIAQETQGVTRTHYIAADEIAWDYIPSGRDMMMGMAPEDYAKFYTQHGPGFIGKVYRKAVYREYTDATFRHLKPRPAQEAYLGIAGPVMHAEVGDTLKIVFRNHGTHPYSMHPRGVLYDKASKGSSYADGVSAAKKGGASVAPGKTFTYTERRTTSTVSSSPSNIKRFVMLGTGFSPANFRYTINVYQFANMPMPKMRVGEHVRWYLMTLGEGSTFTRHTGTAIRCSSRANEPTYYRSPRRRCSLPI